MLINHKHRQLSLIKASLRLAEFTAGWDVVLQIWALGGGREGGREDQVTGCRGVLGQLTFRRRGRHQPSHWKIRQLEKSKMEVIYFRLGV